MIERDHMRPAFERAVTSVFAAFASFHPTIVIEEAR
jgi:hypothetical protein